MKNTTKIGKKVFSLMLVVFMCLSIVPMTDLTIGARAFEDSEYWTEHGLSTDQAVLRFHLGDGTIKGVVMVYDIEEKSFYHTEDYNDKVYDMVPNNSDIKLYQTVGSSVLLPQVNPPENTILGDDYGLKFSGWETYDGGVVYEPGSIFTIPSDAGGTVIEFKAMYEVYRISGVEEGQCGDNVYWNYDYATGKLVISGTGSMYNTWTHFMDSDVKSVVIENGVTSISRQAFEDCKNLESVIIPDSVTSIGDWAFYNTGYYNNEDNWNDGLLIIDGWVVGFMTDYVYIPANVKALAEDVFYTDSPCIKYYEVDSNNKYFSSDNYGALYNKNKTILLYYPLASRNEEFVIPDTVEIIEALDSFYLETLIIPANVKEILGHAPVSFSFKDVYFYGKDTRFSADSALCDISIDQEKWFEVREEFATLYEECVEKAINETITEEYMDEFMSEIERMENHFWLDEEVVFGTIHCYPSSTAEAYAKSKGINCEYIDELEEEPHTCTYGEWYIVTEATVFAEGEKRRDCDCGEYETDVIAKLESAKVEDETTGVEITYTGDNFESEVVVVLEDAVNANIAFGDDYENYKAYDISLEIDGEKVQPEGFVTVKLPLPDGYNAETTVVYYIADNGEKTLIDSTVENGYVIFETDHFSEYVIVDESSKIHKHSYIAVTVNPTCTEQGYTTYTCECGDTYTETIEATGHTFDGSECVNCDYDKADDCTCNCHEGGIKAFFFKILNFFQKLFGKNKVCACGVKH